MLDIRIIFLLLLAFNINTVLSSSQQKVNDVYNGLYTKDVFSGYLDTDIKGTELFFVFLPSQSSPENDPIIMWLTGGPLCSSTFGAFEETGPAVFLPEETKLTINENAWNKNASVFYIDSPGGVGFSKLHNKNYTHSDENQAVSLTIAIQNFFKLFPKYQNNTFYISGLSYAGTYIPHLVTQLFKYMEEHSDAIQLKLKGILIGNPYIYEKIDYEDSMVEFAFSHGLISLETFDSYLKECPHWPQVEKILKTYEEKDNYTFDPVVNKGIDAPTRNVTKACNAVRNGIKSQLNGIFMYGILGKCLPEDFNFTDPGEENKFYSEYNSFNKVIKRAINAKYRAYMYGDEYLQNNENSENEDEKEKETDFSSWCGNDLYTGYYLNKNSTKEKLGVNLTMETSLCSDYPYKWGDSMYFFRDDIKNLNQKYNFTTWLYSGTEDMNVSALSTLRVLKELNYTIKDKWKKWIVDGQVVGMEQTYEHGLRFITVKGSGHMVVRDNRKISKILLDKFIEFNEKDTPSGSETQPEDNNPNDGFPVWAIILISVVSGLLIIVIIIIIILKIRKKNSSDDIEESGKLLKNYDN